MHMALQIFRHNLQMTREIPTTKIARMLTGPEVRGCRPVLGQGGRGQEG